MIQGKRVACVIPARLRSTRFPRKMLASLAGKPLLQRVWERALSVPLFDEVCIAVDAQETQQLVEGFGGRCIMTSDQCPSGTDRLAEVLERHLLKADIWVNWQGDEPFICAEMIGDLLQGCEVKETDVWTLKKRIRHESEYLSPHIAKVVCDPEGYALYFSRSPIPWYRDVASFEQKEVYKHVGLYAYTAEALRRIRTLPVCALESAEQLEQLRFLSHRLKIRVHKTHKEVFGIDLPEHLIRAEERIRASGSL
jgi:3-deoxy-manno-octulosonate cytidylyltransferase (CMP-KDO synthetase)